MEQIKYGRKKNGIRKALNDKLTEWVESIDDEHVRNLVKKNTIVTGGSIASMLLGEPVNDYDCYFKDYTTTIAVAKYYTDKFNDTNKVDVVEGVTEYKPVVKTELYSCPISGIAEERVSIYMKSAGVVAEDQETYNYFELDTPDAATAFADSLTKKAAEGKERYRPIFLSANAITLANDIQLIIRFYGDAEKVHSSFDFAHAMNYYDWQTNDLVLKAEALECLLSRTLIYRGSRYPLCSILRAKKFIERGWRVSAGQLLKIMWQINDLDLTDKKLLEDQLIGCDQAYLNQLLSALKSTDPDRINSAYVAEIIDRIFD